MSARAASSSSPSRPRVSARCPSIAATSCPPTSHWYSPCTASSRALRRALRLEPRTAVAGSLGSFGTILIQSQQQIRHLDRNSGGVAALFTDPSSCLLVVLSRDDPVGDWHAVRQRYPRRATRRFVGDDLEVVGLATDDAAQCDQRIEALARSQLGQRDRDFQRTGHRNMRDVVLVYTEHGKFGDA